MGNFDENLNLGIRFPTPPDISYSRVVYKVALAMCSVVHDNIVLKGKNNPYERGFLYWFWGAWVIFENDIDFSWVNKIRIL